jgi:hypothetical protein
VLVLVLLLLLLVLVLVLVHVQGLASSKDRGTSCVTFHYST